MKIKFNKMERIAGLFVISAAVGAVTVTVGVAVKKGWFESKIAYSTMVENAEGLHQGTLVQIAGLRAGSVTHIQLLDGQRVRLRFEVFESFKDRVREDSYVQVIRPFIIGEKVLDVVIGSEDKAQLAEGTELLAKKSFDVMDMMSGKTMGPILGTLEKLSINLGDLAEAFSNRDRMQKIVSIFDNLDPLIKNLNKMSRGVSTITDSVNKEGRIETILTSVTELSNTINVVMPELAKEAPEMARHLPKMVENLSVLTEEFRKLTPAITAIAPELPRASMRAIEALDETVITLKSLQKSFLMRGNVEDVREEEQKRKARIPASSDTITNEGAK